MVAQRPIDNGVAEDAMWPHGMACPPVKSGKDRALGPAHKNAGMKGRDI